MAMLKFERGEESFKVDMFDKERTANLIKNLAKIGFKVITL